MHERGYSNGRRSRHRLTPGTVKFAAYHVLSLEGSDGLNILDVAEKIQVKHRLNILIGYVTWTLHFALRTRVRSLMLGHWYGTLTLYFRYKNEYIDVSDTWTLTIV